MIKIKLLQIKFFEIIHFINKKINFKQNNVIEIKKMMLENVNKFHTNNNLPIYYNKSVIQSSFFNNHNIREFI